MAEILITEFMDEAAVARLADVHGTLYDPGLADRQSEIHGFMHDCRALIVRNRTLVDAAVLAGPMLQCVGRLGVGLDNIDMETAGKHGIAVYPATGANDLAVAEYVIAAAMLLLRGAYFATTDVAGGSWPRQRLVGRELSGKMLGLVGFGAIARQTAAKAGALGMQVCGYDPYLPLGDPAWAGAERLDLGALLERSDVVSLHVPLTDATRHMIDGAAIARMKPGAILVNAARGGVADEEAVAAALRSGRLSGAALDVFEIEPLTQTSGARFAGIGNLILTPHVAGVTVESNVRVSEMIAGLVLEHLGRTK